MALTNEAKALAKYLVKAWDDGVIESNFTLIDVTAGSSTNTRKIAPGLGVLKRDEFKTPELSALMELASFSDLIWVSEEPPSWEHTGRWTVQLSQNLREAVERDFTPVNKSVEVQGMPSFFISYKHEEESFAAKLYGYLSRVYGSGQVWIDKEIPPSELWWKKIIAEIKRRDFLVYLLSREALESVYCRAEFTEAWRFGKRIIPVKLRNANYPSDITQFQYVTMMNSEITVESIVDLFFAIVQPVSDVPTVPTGGQWDTRSIRPLDKDSIEITLKVPANREPGDEEDRPYCNTGVLLVFGDELYITANGTVTIDRGRTWYDSFGVVQKSDNPTWLGSIFDSDETYRATGYSKKDVGDNGVVGSLIGWIGNDKTALKKAFFVETDATKPVVKGEKGFLHLAVNDVTGSYGDNQGAFEVTIRVTHATEE